MLPSEYPDSWSVRFLSARGGDSVLPLAPQRTLYAKGTVFSDLERVAMELPCDIVVDRDVPVELRDGVIIYTDVLRPSDVQDPMPAIINWSPYGKHTPIPTLPPESIYGGVPPEQYSGLAKIGGADAAYWCSHGYAIVNPDPRGVQNSQGDIYAFGSVESADGYDLVEWAAAQEWSNGKIALHGRSWLAISQFGIAALQPPHLAAIAPFTSHFYDIFRGHLAAGGIPFGDYLGSIMTTNVAGCNRAEDLASMLAENPLMNEYWQDKIADMRRIQVPMYVAGSYGTSTDLAAMGWDLEGFLDAGTHEKWLRINNVEGRIIDQYEPQNQADLLRFFDRYTKGIDNGWEETPKVRLPVTNPGGTDQLNIPFGDWPLPETEYRKLYLDGAAESLSLRPIEAPHAQTYAAKSGEIGFTVEFDEDTYLVGYPKLHLWVEVAGAQEMDLFVVVEKIDDCGNPLKTALGYPGPDGRMRVSLRALDPQLSTDYQPVQSLTAHQYLSAGEIVPIEMRIAPTGMLWRKGERLRVRVAGDALNYPTVFGTPTTENQGDHIIHTGGSFDSFIQLPIVAESVVQRQAGLGRG